MPTPIIFGVLMRDANEKWPSRNQLMLALAEHTPVILLEYPRFSRQLIEIVKPKTEQIDKNLFIMRNAFGLRYQKLGKRMGAIAAALDGKWFHQALAQIGIQEYIYWLEVNDQRMLWGIPDERMIYDCMDPNFFPETQIAFDQTEAIIGRRAKLVFCSAHTLYAKMSKINPNCYLLPNATSIDTIEAVKTGNYTVPEPLKDRKRPYIGYLGTVDWRFAPQYIYEAAKRLPEYTFVLVGRVNDPSYVKDLVALPNVVITGQVSYEEGHAYNLAFDVGLIPFTPGPMNDAINSVKMFMYLAAGKPVVSTWIEESRRNPYVVATQNPLEFAEAIRQAATEEDADAMTERRAYAWSNTWYHRAIAAIEHLSNAGMYN